MINHHFTFIDFGSSLDQWVGVVTSFESSSSLSSSSYTNVKQMNKKLNGNSEMVFIFEIKVDPCKKQGQNIPSFSPPTEVWILKTKTNKQKTNRMRQILVYMGAL